MIKLLIISIFIFSNQVFSEDKKISSGEISGSVNLPKELNLLINSLHIQTGDNIKDLSLINSIMRIDDYAQTLTSEDIFMIGKIEIYKSLLKKNAPIAKATINQSSIKTLEKAILKTNDPFAKWFLQAMLQDCKSLLNNSSYNEYQIQKNSGEFKSVELKRINKKVQLLYSWLLIIIPTLPNFQEILLAELRTNMIEAIYNIEQSFFLLASSSSYKTPTASINSVNELRFFKVIEVKPTPVAPKKKDKTVEDILAPLVDEQTNPATSLPSPSNENWLDNEDAPATLKNLPKPNNDADWLEDF